MVAYGFRPVNPFFMKGFLLIAVLRFQYNLWKSGEFTTTFCYRIEILTQYPEIYTQLFTLSTAFSTGLVLLTQCDN